MKRIALAFFAAFLCTYLALGVAHAQGQPLPDPQGGWTPAQVQMEDQVPTPQLGGKSGKWTWQPSTAVGLQLNLKTGDYERLALAIGYGLTYHGRINVGLAAYVGAGISNNNPNAAQGSLMVTLLDAVAVGPGVQVYKDRAGDGLVWQALLTVAWNLTNAATLDGLGEFLRETGRCVM